mgnify:CR=1 FL=1
MLSNAHVVSYFDQIVKNDAVFKDSVIQRTSVNTNIDATVWGLELESLISEHAAVLSVAVVGIADEQWGERPMAMVVCEPGKYLDRKILETHLQGFVECGRINKWAIPKQFKFVAEIPKTSVGKINKKLIRESVLD